MRQMQGKKNSSNEGKQREAKQDKAAPPSVEQTRYSTYPIICLKQPVDRNFQKVKFHIYLPGFLRLQLKNITKIQLENLKGEINATLIFTIYYGDLLKSSMLTKWMPGDEKQRKEVQDSILDALKNQFQIQFFQGQSITLTEGKKMVPKNIDQEKKRKQDEQQQVERNLEVKMKHQEEKKQIKFSVRRLFQVSLQSQITLAPFNLTYCNLSMTVQPIQFTYKFQLPKTKEEKEIELKIEVNLLEPKKTNENFSHSQVFQFGEYGIASSQRQVIYDDEWIQDILANEAKKGLQYKKKSRENISKLKFAEEDQKRIFTEPQYIQYRKKYREILKKQGNLKSIYEEPDQDQKILNEYWKEEIEDFNIQTTPSKQGFRYACFVIPLFKHFRPLLLSIFAPVVFLAVLNLFIFFQDQNLATRIGSIATLMVAFISLFPTIRAHSPPSSQVMILEIVVYLFIFTSFLALVQSWRIYDFPTPSNIQSELQIVRQQVSETETEKYSFVWYQSPQFLLAIIIDIISAIIILVLILCYGYSTHRQNQDESDEYHQFNREQWSNTQCEHKFKELYKSKFKLSQKIKVVEIRE